MSWDVYWAQNFNSRTHRNTNTINFMKKWKKMIKSKDLKSVIWRNSMTNWLRRKNPCRFTVLLDLKSWNIDSRSQKICASFLLSGEFFSLNILLRKVKMNDSKTRKTLDKRYHYSKTTNQGKKNWISIWLQNRLCITSKGLEIISFY